MTNQEEIKNAIEWIEGLRDGWNDKDNVKYCNMAIKALEGADLDGYSSRLWKAAYERGKEEAEQANALGKIKAKLIEEKECAYADFERYKVEYLGQDWSDVYDSLPQDDFRYGLERCIDIINKYIAESEDKV